MKQMRQHLRKQQASSEFASVSSELLECNALCNNDDETDIQDSEFILETPVNKSISSSAPFSKTKNRSGSKSRVELFRSAKSYINTGTQTAEYIPEISTRKKESTVIEDRYLEAAGLFR